MILRSILSPIDFSDQARHALRIAGVLATRQPGRLVVLTVVHRLLAEAARLHLGEERAREDNMSALREFVSAMQVVEAMERSCDSGSWEAVSEAAPSAVAGQGGAEGAGA